MFVLSVLQDLVRILPSEFGVARCVGVTNALNKRYANRVGIKKYNNARSFMMLD